MPFTLKRICCDPTDCLSHCTRICSDPTDCLSRCITKALHIKRLGYPVDLLMKAFRAVCQLERSTLLIRKDKNHGTKTRELMPLFGITTFRPSCKVYNHTLRKNWELLGINNSLIEKELYGIIQARLDRHTQTGITAPKSKSTSSRCKTRHCLYCLALDKSGMIILPGLM